ncbi:MAG: hypothetical protein AAB668_04225 [Patescibacteria group bacterium]
MTTKREPTSSGLVTSTQHDLIKHEIFSIVSGDELTPEGVATLASRARLRFNENMVWSIGAVGLKRVLRETRAPLASLFNEFRIRGGILIVVIGAADGYVASALQICAFNAGNVPLKIVKNASAASELIKKFRAEQTKS